MSLKNTTTQIFSDDTGIISHEGLNKQGILWTSQEGKKNAISLFKPRAEKLEKIHNKTLDLKHDEGISYKQTEITDYFQSKNS